MLLQALMQRFNAVMFAVFNSVTTVYDIFGHVIIVSVREC